MVDKAFESHDFGATSVQPPARTQSFHSTLLLCMLALFPHFPGDGEMCYCPVGAASGKRRGRRSMACFQPLLWVSKDLPILLSVFRQRDRTRTQWSQDAKGSEQQSTGWYHRHFQVALAPGGFSILFCINNYELHT